MSKKKLSKPRAQRVGKILSATLYVYVEPGNRKYVDTKGKEPKFGTASAYINALIAKDRGVKPKQGTKGQVLAKGKKESKTSPKSSKRTIRLGSKKTKKSTAKQSLSVSSVPAEAQASA